MNLLSRETIHIHSMLNNGNITNPMNKKLRIVAILAVRNEEIFIKRCIEHLALQGVDIYIIDNDSSDNTIAIAEKYLNKGVIHIESLPYDGSFNLTSQLTIKERISRSLDADWFIHHDADEIRFAPKPYKTLHEGISAVDNAGFTAINFDEFVFLPTSREESYEETDYVKDMMYYYYFAPKKLRRINAWKNTGQEIDLCSSGGHQVKFENIRIFERNFILRHYIFLSYNHACMKYGSRTHNKSELKRGWHIERHGFDPEKLQLPHKNQLKKIAPNREMDTSDPWTHHRFFGESKFSYLTRKAFYKFFHFNSDK